MCDELCHAKKSVYRSIDPSEQAISPVVDRVGICLSSLCAVHCIVLPFLITSFPLLGLQLFDSPAVHPLLAGFVVISALSATIPGYLRHRKSAVPCLMSGGLMLVLFATFVAGPVLGESYELPIITVGNLMVIGAHLFDQHYLHFRRTSHEQSL